MAERHVEITDNNSNTSQRIGRTVRISDNNGDVDDIICLEGGRITDNNGHVNLFAPFGVEIHRSDNNGRVKVRYRTCVQLLEIAQGYDR